MAALAIAGREWLEPANERRRAGFAFGLDVRDIGCRGLAAGRAGRAVMSAAVEGKGMTARAVGFAARAEALFRLPRSMAELCLALVTLGAALRRHFADRALAHVVTVGTRDLGLDDVKAVPAHATCGEPSLLNVQPASVRSVTRGLATATR